jgi:hypothetical protein
MIAHKHQQCLQAAENASRVASSKSGLWPTCSVDQNFILVVRFSTASASVPV